MKTQMELQKYLFGESSSINELNEKQYQNLINNILTKCLNLQGVGCGSQVGLNSTGENILFQNIIPSLSQSPIIFDVGANVGEYTNMILNSMNEENYQIHCFEPAKNTFDILKKRFSSNKNIVLNSVACGNINGKSTLYEIKESSGISSMTKRRLDHYNVIMDITEDIVVTTLDVYCFNNKIPYIDFLKIDVEGHELDVLNGSLNLFENKKIKFVQFEFGGCNIDTRTYLQDFYYFFKDFDFCINRIMADGSLCEITIYREILEQFNTTNFLAYNKELIYE